MNQITRLFLLSTLALSLAACGKLGFGHGSKPPSGQVAATVSGREITVRELQAELGSIKAANTVAAQKQQQQTVLELMVQRVALAEAARKQGLDKDPNFILASNRALDALLVQQLQAHIAAAVPPPSQEQVDQFIAANPDIFAERKIFDVEQIRARRPADPSVLQKMQPLKTLDEVAALLTQNHIGFGRGMGSIDAVGQSPKLVSAILALPPSEVFIISSGNDVMINQIRGTRTEPFTGDAARKYAMNFLKAQNTQLAVQRQLSAILAQSAHDIQFNKEFAPTKPGGAAPKKG